MSSFIFENGKFITFKNFLLSESIKPKSINFGTNKEFNDNNILNINNTFATSFLYDNLLYTVIISNDELGFHYTKIENINFDDFNYLESIENDSFLQIGSSNAAKVFGYVFYISIEIIKRYDLNTIVFDGEHDKLQSVYNRLLSNKFFKYEFEKLNFKYKFEDKHIFYK